METRRNFIQQCLGTIAGASLIPLVGTSSGCGDDPVATTDAGRDSGLDSGHDSGIEAGNECSPMEVIAGNHGHTLEVTTADIDAGIDKTYSIDGLAGHSHQVTLIAAHFTTLASGGTVVVVSSPLGVIGEGGHNHEVTVSCAST